VSGAWLDSFADLSIHVKGVAMTLDSVARPTSETALAAFLTILAKFVMWDIF